MDAYGEGFRVPTLVISPWAKHAYIDHTQYELASMLRLAEDNFNLPTLGVRDVKANDMMNSFDFNQAPQPTLIEPADFVGPAPEISSATTQTTPIPELNPTHTGLILALVMAVCVDHAQLPGRVERCKKQPSCASPEKSTTGCPELAFSASCLTR